MELFHRGARDRLQGSLVSLRNHLASRCHCTLQGNSSFCATNFTAAVNSFTANYVACNIYYVDIGPQSVAFFPTSRHTKNYVSGNVEGIEYSTTYQEFTIAPIHPVLAGQSDITFTFPIQSLLPSSRLLNA